MNILFSPIKKGASRFVRCNCLLFAIAVSFCLFGCSPEDHREVSVIYISHSRFGYVEHEYKVDLRNKEFWKYRLEDYSSRDNRRDEMSENEGFSFVGDLTTKEIEDFSAAMKRFAFTTWEGDYGDSGGHDGHQWSMIIVFLDGTMQVSSGSNMYPKRWREMFTAFEDLTGERALFITS